MRCCIVGLIRQTQVGHSSFFQRDVAHVDKKLAVSWNDKPSWIGRIVAPGFSEKSATGAQSAYRSREPSQAMDDDNPQYVLINQLYGLVTENVVYPMTQWFCWSDFPTKWLFHWGYTPFSDIPIFHKKCGYCNITCSIPSNMFIHSSKMVLGGNTGEPPTHHRIDPHVLCVNSRLTGGHILQISSIRC